MAEVGHYPLMKSKHKAIDRCQKNSVLFRIVANIFTYNQVIFFTFKIDFTVAIGIENVDNSLY